MTWKRLSSKKILQHSRLTVVEDELLIPGNKRIKYLRFAESGNSVTVICKRSDGKILLQKEYSYPVGQKLLQFPGGFVPKGESLRKGAARELAEEAGLKAGSLTLLGTYFKNNRRSSSKMFVYLAEGLRPANARRDPEEQIESHWYRERELERLLGNNGIKNYSVLAAWTLYAGKKFS